MKSELAVTAGVVGLIILMMSTKGAVSTQINKRRMKGERWNNLLPSAKSKAIALLRMANDEGLNVMFWDGWRSPSETIKNMKAGTTKVKDPYGSLHTWGSAFDIVFSRNGQPYWPPATDPRWQRLGAIGKRLGLVWGGNFRSFFDGPHFQLPGVSVSRLKQRYGNDYMAYLASRGGKLV